MIGRRRVAAGLLAVVLIAMPARPAHALFGEENWLSGENEILIAQLVAQLKSLTELTAVVTNITQLVRTANQTLALARWARRTYEMVVHYRWKDLVDDARRGLYAAMPEAEDLANEVDELVSKRAHASSRPRLLCALQRDRCEHATGCTSGLFTRVSFGAMADGLSKGVGGGRDAGRCRHARRPVDLRSVRADGDGRSKGRSGCGLFGCESAVGSAE